MNYKKIYDQLMADRKAKEPKVFSGLTYKQRQRKNQVIDGVIYENHHIIPRFEFSGKGLDESDNVVSLPVGEHFLAHLLLAKAKGGKHWSAVWIMANMQGNSNLRDKDKKVAILSRKWYEKARKLSAKNVTKWTPNLIKQDALKYKTKTEWATNSPGATFAASYRYGIYDECVAHMKVVRISWSKDLLIKKAKELVNNGGGSSVQRKRLFLVSRRHNCYQDVCKILYCGEKYKNYKSVNL